MDGPGGGTLFHLGDAEALARRRDGRVERLAGGGRGDLEEVFGAGAEMGHPEIVDVAWEIYDRMMLTTDGLWTVLDRADVARALEDSHGERVVREVRDAIGPAGSALADNLAAVLIEPTGGGSSGVAPWPRCGSEYDPVG